MSINNIQSPEDFRLNKVYISADRFKQSRTIDVTNIVVEFNIFENITLPYLTGSIAILDDNGLFDVADFQGTEGLTIIVSLPNQPDNIIRKTFILNSVERSIQTNDRSAILVFSMVEDVLFYNNVQTISKTYDGTGEEIIKNVLNDKLNKNLFSRYETYKPSFQSAFRIISPYLNPFQVVSMALNKMTTENGSPYFLYSTMYSNDLVLADLDTILRSSPLNNAPFTYSQSTANNENNDPVLLSTSIYDIKMVNQEDTMMLSELGVINSYFEAFDISTGKVNNSEFSLNQLYDKLFSTGIIDPQLTNKLIDYNFIPDQTKVDERGLGDYQSKRFSLAVGANTYPYESQVNNWTSETDTLSYILRLNSYALKNLLLKNQMQIMVPGLNFTHGDKMTSVGRNIDLLCYKTNVSTNIDRMQRDHRKSGKFIITSKRHIFNATDFKHNVSITCSRISNERQRP